MSKIPNTTTGYFSGFDSRALAEDRGDYAPNVIVYTTPFGVVLTGGGWGTTMKQQRSNARMATALAYSGKAQIHS